MIRLGKGVAGMALAVAVGACVPASDPYPGVADPAPGGVNQCGALDLQYLLGAPARDLETIRFNKPVRVIRPGMAVTMDFSPERLNIQIDREGRISQVTCG